MDDQRVRHDAVLDTKRRFTEAAERPVSRRHHVESRTKQTGTQPDAGRSGSSNERYTAATPNAAPSTSNLVV